MEICTFNLNQSKKKTSLNKIIKGENLYSKWDPTMAIYASGLYQKQKKIVTTYIISVYQNILL